MTIDEIIIELRKVEGKIEDSEMYLEEYNQLLTTARELLEKDERAEVERWRWAVDDLFKNNK